MSDLVENTRTDFVSNIQKWVIMDSQIKLMNDKIKKARELKHTLLENITKYVETNNIENVKIEISDGELKFYEKREYQPISFGYVEESLGKIIPDKTQVNYIMNYLREHREVKTSKDIRRNYTASSVKK